MEVLCKELLSKKCTGRWLRQYLPTGAFGKYLPLSHRSLLATGMPMSGASTYQTTHTRIHTLCIQPSQHSAHTTQIPHTQQTPHAIHTMLTHTSHHDTHTHTHTHQMHTSRSSQPTPHTPCTQPPQTQQIPSTTHAIHTYILHESKILKLSPTTII